MKQKKNNIPAIYIHIPFCKKVCPFCSFAVMKENSALHSTYIDLLRQEVQLLKKDVLRDVRISSVESIYFGGGTPSILTGKELRQIVKLVKDEFGFTSNCQWSIEMNPDDVTWEKVTELKEMGMNRVSLGVQSFNDENLKTLGRSHSAQQSFNAIQLLKENGFSNLNLDLMYGYPGQTITDLNRDLEQFVKQSPTHISPYCLNIEPKTALNRKQEWKDWQSSHEEQLYQMFLLITNYLEKSRYIQYEVSNFCLEGFRSKQNQFNWEGMNYLGIGAGAHSYLYPHRWGNEKRYIDYKKSVLVGKLPQDFLEVLNAEEELDEYIMIRLRLKEGLDLKAVEKIVKFSVEIKWKAKIERLINSGLAVLNDNRLKLTPKGLFLTDEIAAELAAAI